MYFKDNNFELENIDLNQLKNITSNAQRLQREEETRKRQEILFKEKLEKQRKENEAKTIIQGIAYVVKQAASEGRSSVPIMELKWEDFTRSYSGNFSDRLNPKRLELKAKLVWDYLELKGLKPDFFTAVDGYGEKSWDYIQANW